MNKIAKIAKLALEITDADISWVEQVIEEQSAYMNPLRMATSAWQSDLAKHNQAVLNAVLALKKVVEAGENIVDPRKKAHT